MQKTTPTLALWSAWATCGIASGARPVLNALSTLVQEKGLTDKISVTQTGCIGLCQYRPIVEGHGTGQTEDHLHQNECGQSCRVVERHLIGGHIVEEYTLNSADLK